jgi:hypothetical protein
MRFEIESKIGSERPEEGFLMHDIAPCLRGKTVLRASDARARAVRRAVKALKGLQRAAYALHEARGHYVRADNALRRFKVCLMAVAGELHAIIEESASPSKLNHPPAAIEDGRSLGAGRVGRSTN